MAAKIALVVDDSKSARLLLQKTLERFHLQVETSASVKEALIMLGHKKIDIVFLDYVMSDVNGLEAIPLIKNLPGYSKTPIVMCSSQENTEYRLKALAQGAFDFLPKPCSPKHLAHVLRKIIPELSTKYLSTETEMSPLKLDDIELDTNIQEAFRKLSHAKREIPYSKLQTLLDEKLSHFRRVLLLEIESTVDNAMQKTLHQFQKTLDEKLEERIQAYTDTQASRLSENAFKQAVSQQFNSFEKEILALVKEDFTELKKIIQGKAAPSSSKLLTDVKHLAHFTAAHHAATTAEKIAQTSAANLIKNIAAEQLDDLSTQTLHKVQNKIQPKIKNLQKISMAAVLISLATLFLLLFK